MSIFTGAVTLLLLAGGVRSGERRPVPLYTNDDLARIAVARGEPADAPATTAPTPPRPPRPERTDAADETKTEAYWRARARRLEEKLEPLRDALADLQLQLAEARRSERARSASTSSRSPRTRPTGEGGGESRLVARITRLEARIREAELRLEDDARRAGALPGWLR
jgi:hypothetical protein